MDDLIEDAVNKNLISFEHRPRWLTLGKIYGATKDMNKLPELDLNIYWTNYIEIHGDYCSRFLNCEV